MSVNEDFATVDAVLASASPTSRVDAFALTLMKVEGQARELFTDLVHAREQRRGVMAQAPRPARKS